MKITNVITECWEKNHRVKTYWFLYYALGGKGFCGLERVAPTFLCTENGRTLGGCYSLKQRHCLSHSNRNPPIPRHPVLTHKPAFRYANNNILLSAVCPIIFPLFHQKGVSVLCSWQWICKEEFEKARPARTAASASLIAGIADVRRCIRRLGC